MNDLFALDDDVPFTLRLSEAIAWCKARVPTADISRSLRSQTLQPRYEMQFVWSYRHSLYVNSVLRARRQALRSVLSVPVTPPANLANGRLLFYFPDEQVDDGASEMASKGFFDERDAPAWDTWVGVFKDDQRGQYIVSWIPAELLQCVAEGIAVNMVDCVGWLDKIEFALSKELTKSGLVWNNAD